MSRTSCVLWLIFWPVLIPLYLLLMIYFVIFSGIEVLWMTLFPDSLG